jgi:hypothetical protein
LRRASEVDLGCGMGGRLATFASTVWPISLARTATMSTGRGSLFPRTISCPATSLSRCGWSARSSLVVSLEVAQHLPQPSADAFVESLTSLGPIVLFSAASVDE